MPKTQSWDLELDGEDYRVSLKRNWMGKIELAVNEKIVEFKPLSISQMLVGREEVLNFGENRGILVLKGGKADLALDGVYVGSEKPYQPLGIIPKWGWFFIGLSALAIFAGGAIPAVLGLLGANYCAKVSASNKLKTPAKVAACSGITFLVWLLIIVISGLITSLL